MTSGRSLAGFADSRPHQGDQSEAVNRKPGRRARPYLSAESIGEVLGLGEQNSEDMRAEKQRHLPKQEKEVAELQPA